jgi:hypothetical protein
VPPSKYTAALLAPIVASSRSFSEVLRKLGLETTGGNHRYITARIRYVGIDTSHLNFGAIAKQIQQLTRQQLEPLVRECTSVAGVLLRLGLPQQGRPHRDVKAKLAALELDTQHFRGAGWSRGETRATHPSVDRAFLKRTRPDEEVFVENAPPTNGSKIVKRLLRRGVPYGCALCGIYEWRGNRLVLHLDHINGVNNDNRLTNLRLLCPNCHSQTDTYGRRNSRASEPWVVLYEELRERGGIGRRTTFR